MKPIKNLFDLEIKNIHNSENKIECSFIVSNPTLNRSNAIVNSKGVDFTNYLKNPIVLWGHNSDIPAIGRAKNLRIENNAIISDVEFDMEDPFAALIAGKVQRNFIKAVSISFLPLTVRQADPKEFGLDKIYPGMGSKVTVYETSEMLEFSIVNIPNNAETVSNKAKGIGLSIDDMYKMVNNTKIKRI